METTALANRLSEMLKKRGMTQKEFAERLGVTEVSVSRYITGKRIPRATIIMKMEKIFGVSVGYLMSQETNLVEMIISYTTDGTDYQYHDNHGILVRCKKCKHYNSYMQCGKKVKMCERNIMIVDDNDFCSYAERKERDGNES